MEEIVFETAPYLMDSSNGRLYDPDTNQKVGQWEANYGYSVPDNCEGIVTWVKDGAECHRRKTMVSLQNQESVKVSGEGRQ
jgi:hypothetical protein